MLKKSSLGYAKMRGGEKSRKSPANSLGMHKGFYHYDRQDTDMPPDTEIELQICEKVK
jgi:hypothetical protein